MKLRLNKTMTYLLLAVAVSGTVYLGAPLLKPKDVVERHIALLSAPEWSIRERAAAALGKLADPRAIEPLIDCLRTGDAPMRDVATDALTALGQAPLPALVACFDDDDPSVRERAMTILGRIGDRSAVKPLISYLDREPTLDDITRDPGHTRIAAVRALGILGDVQAIEPLVAELSMYDPSCEAPVEALARIGRPVLHPVIGALIHGSWQTRNGAVKTLTCLGAPAIETLAEYLDDSDPSVRYAIVAALAQIGSEKAMVHVTKSLHDPDYSVRTIAQHVLANRKESSSDGE